MCLNSPTANLNPDYIIFNFSNWVLTQNGRNILSRGLNFATPCCKLDYCNLIELSGINKDACLLAFKKAVENICSAKNKGAGIGKGQ